MYSLALFDSTFNYYQFNKTDISETMKFLRGNLSNLKLKMIGSSFIRLMFIMRMYYETADIKDLELKSAKNIEA